MLEARNISAINTVKLPGLEEETNLAEQIAEQERLTNDKR